MGHAILHGILVTTLGVGFPVLLLLVINLSTVPRLSRPRTASATVPRVSMIVPARNEQRSIAAGVASLLAQDYADFEIIVVNDRSTDGTGEILGSIARGHSRLRMIEGQEPPAGWLGKPYALHQGTLAATGELFLFVDADVRYDPRCLGEAVAFFEHRRLDFLALLPRLEAEGFWEKVLMPNLLTTCFFGPLFLANCDRPRWLGVGGGAGNLIRRLVYEKIGGHQALKDSVIDDVHLALRAKRAGYRSRVALANDRVSVRMYRGFREIWDGFTKNVAYAFNGVLGTILVVLTAATLVVAVFPPAVLLATLFGVPVASKDVWLAAVGFGLAVLARLVLASALGDPLWPATTHAIMTAVWAGIICRSFFYRIIRRRLTWRGREFDARAARF